MMYWPRKEWLLPCGCLHTSGYLFDYPRIRVWLIDGVQHTECLHCGAVIRKYCPIRIRRRK